MQFFGHNESLENAIKADDPVSVLEALTAGAEVNGRGKHDVTPLGYAIGIKSKNAAKALIENGANPNLIDAEGDSAVSLAVTAYTTDSELLEMVLDAGGNPNIRRSNGNPVIERFINDHNLEGISYLHSKGADLNLEIGGRPMLADASLTNDWDVVLHLLHLGASLNSPRVQEAILSDFKNPESIPPDSPLYPDKVKVYNYLKSKGLNPVAPVPSDGSEPKPAVRN